jgi:hypothetical protein
MIIVEENKKRINLNLTLFIAEESIIEFRKLLFENGLSVQEFVGFLCNLSHIKNQQLLELVDLAKEYKSKNNSLTIKNLKLSSPDAIYNILEKKSAFNNAKLK